MSKAVHSPSAPGGAAANGTLQPFDSRRLEALYKLTQVLADSETVADMHEQALDCLLGSLSADRAAILLMDEAEVMRFVAWRGLSDSYRAAVEGHSPWQPDDPQAEPVLVPDVRQDESLADFGPLFEDEGIGALAFIPLTYRRKLIGKFMLYYRKPHVFEDEAVAFKVAVARHLASATERKRAEQARDEEHRRLDALFANAQNAFLLVSQDMRVLQANPAALALTGYDQSKIANMHAREFVDESLAERLEEVWAEFLSKGLRHGEFNIRTAHGSKPVEYHAAANILPGLHLFVLHDTSERRAAEEEIRRIEERFQKTFQASPAAISITRARDKVLLDVNDAFCRVVGFERDALINTPLDELTLWATPEEEARFQRAIAEDGAIRQGEFTLRTRQGELRNTIGSAEVIDLSGEPCVVALFYDITDRKQLEESLRRSNEAKDEFLGLVSHEMRNGLTTIMGGATVVRSLDKDMRPDLAAVLEDVAHDARRLQVIVDNMLLIARLDFGQKPDLEPVLLSRFLQRFAKDVQLKGSGAQCELVIDDRTPTVMANASYLEQVMVNLLSNSRKYSPPPHRVRLELRGADDEAILSVRDWGPGVPHPELEAIFDRFRRSDNTGTRAGLGLGLTVCQRLIEAQHGRIWASLPEGGGLEVSFSLPAIDLTRELDGIE